MLRALTSACSSRCANITFTKNPEKYHKYRAEDVEEMIEKLFDTSAWAGLLFTLLPEHITTRRQKPLPQLRPLPLNISCDKTDVFMMY